MLQYYTKHFHKHCTSGFILLVTKAPEQRALNKSRHRYLL